jgi:ribonuclease P protein component
MQDRFRLKNGSDFRRVYSARRRRDGTLMTLYVKPNQLDHARLGVVVSTKVGGAVVRNTVKRRLREASRALVETIDHDGVDFVVVARPEAAAATFAALAEEVQRLLDVARRRPEKASARYPAEPAS